ncbi:Alpha-L-arabinofuranosidase B, catalytic [Kalmanozyma brasiliensis GHG001]|uniref:Alpha-L-arabinofuranosidase n=1 Tax=Kalmanozyma brasiliensis (strain GHG001) TaxID=1365824 RepID=V5GNB2_KALBG|nr:Alpha-L-arabinofuranosidase B, catalytic [Kalmanozyma brasiliensis GHG001]EST07452.1 Alpha-L-arabinofuranosidase B, catalytic [Kalmanozyma brasiliensis GHG001]
MAFNKALLLTALSLASTVSAVPAATGSSGLPCDIYANGGTPCVAAHSTTRSLYSSYTGPLYQVVRASDGHMTNISPLSAGSVANAATQDNFCANTSCQIKTIYDQSGRANHLTLAPNGGAASGDVLASATAAPVTLNGHKVYGVYVHPGVGYRNDNTNGIATGNNPEGIYAVLDGTHYNGGCCFDYGNAETSNTDTGNAHMEAIYFGTNSYWGSGQGSGPWLMSDQENGLFSGYNPKQNTADPSQTSRFVTGIVKGDSSNLWALRGGNSQSGGLSTYYSGQRPSGYYPMKKEGAIILGIGGDNSNSGQGTFYEGVMTTGYPSDQTENAVQANIVAAGYAA